MCKKIALNLVIKPVFCISTAVGNFLLRNNQLQQNEKVLSILKSLAINISKFHGYIKMAL